MNPKRVRLQMELESLLGSKEAYFQPPNKIKMRYPAIVYYLDRVNTDKADNLTYAMYDRYALTIMTKDADSDLHRRILAHFPMSSYDRSARNDNIYHHYLTLYY